VGTLSGGDAPAAGGDGLGGDVEPLMARGNRTWRRHGDGRRRQPTTASLTRDNRRLSLLSVSFALCLSLLSLSFPLSILWTRVQVEGTEEDGV
jgi:hypothetical protein